MGKKPSAGDKREALVWHNQLADILENGTPEQFRNGMTAHPENHLARLFE